MGLRLRTEKKTVWLKINSALEVEQVEKDYSLKDGEAKFHLAILDPKEASSIMDKGVKSVWEKGQRFEKLDMYKIKALRISKCFLNWEGIVDENDSPIPFSEDNKESLFRFNPHVVNALLEKLQEYEEDHKVEAEAIEKN